MTILRSFIALAFCTCAAFIGLPPLSALAKPSEKPFEISPGSFQFKPSTNQAAAHSDWVTSFDFDHLETGAEAGQTDNDVRTIIVNLPAGFDASNTAVPTCSGTQLLAEHALKGGGTVGTQVPDCPIASQVGQVSFETANGTPGRPPAQFTVPLYNVEVTSYGVAAELGFRTTAFTQVLVVRVRPDDEGLTITTPNIPSLEVRNVKVTVWGLPASTEHDAQRGETCGLAFEVPALCSNAFGGPQKAYVPVKPFLSNPTSCGPFTASMEADSWEHPEEWSKAADEVVPIEECERVPFEPSIEVQPSTRAAESPSGLDVSLLVPQSWENPYSISTANLKDAKVTLPAGFTVNPSAGAGLGACTPAQYGSESASSLPGEGCPAESKIGSIEIETPLLAEKIPGAIYVATPYDNPFNEPGHPSGSLLALYVVAKDPARGIIIKVAGKLEANPVTGQLVSTFEDNPQQPFSKFTLKFRPGATAPLVSPSICGGYAAEATLTPWSAPLQPRLLSSLPFEITQGVHESACPSGGVPPLKPQVVAGTQNNSGGSYSPFYLRIVREDGEQEITKFSTVLPSGLTGNLTGVPFCPDAAIEAARVHTGQQELDAPACPAASEIGHSLVGAGVGGVLAWTPGKVYFAGPYHGAPFSIVSVTSATVGPFDLGTVVIRFALRINPVTAQVEVDSTGSDPIPHIIDGIVVHVRDIHVYVDRHNFILNPTSCAPTSIADSITGAGADPANPADQASVALTSPFQAADCQSLSFKPTFQASTEGRTSRTDGASLTVKLSFANTPFGSQANIHSVKVELPRQLPSRLSTLQKACTDTTFNSDPAACPAASRVGVARAITPILPVPLEGPAYFVSHGGAKFPELILVLQGYGVTIDLHGETFISKAGITSSTFPAVPDQPVTNFELTLPEGPDSALAANVNLCTTALKMPTTFIAQNGIQLQQSTAIAVTGCKPAIRILRHTVKGAVVTLTVSVPSAGKLHVGGSGLSHTSTTLRKGGKSIVKLTLSRNEKRMLATHPGRRLKLRVRLMFTPDHGRPITAAVTVLMG